MPTAVFLTDEQDDHPVDTDLYMRLANDVLSAEKVGDAMEVSVLFVDEVTISQLNERYLGKSGPTDVLSFPMEETGPPSGRVPDNGGSGPGFDSDDDDGADEEVALLGDVVICPSVAFANAPDHAGNYEDEMALLLVHGILHLLGMDHEEPEEAEAMETRERELLGAYYKELPTSAWPEKSTDPGGLEQE